MLILAYFFNGPGGPQGKGPFNIPRTFPTKYSQKVRRLQEQLEEGEDQEELRMDVLILAVVICAAIVVNGLRTMGDDAATTTETGDNIEMDLNFGFA